MNKKEVKEKLEKERKILEEQLQSFAKEDPHLKGDWDTRFPKHNGGIGGQLLEDAADEVEEYVTRLPIEHNLELRLRDINLALEKIDKGNYGKCENCGKKIDEKRLAICPEAKFCLNCRKK